MSGGIRGMRRRGSEEVLESDVGGPVLAKHVDWRDLRFFLCGSVASIL